MFRPDRWRRDRGCEAHDGSSYGPAQKGMSCTQAEYGRGVPLDPVEV
jgi:hypothetical protein